MLKGLKINMPLRILIENWSNIGLPKVSILCPKCNNEKIFYNVWSHKCDACKFHLRNINSIHKDECRRLKFHREGFAAVNLNSGKENKHAIIQKPL